MGASIGICVNASILRLHCNSFSYASAPLTGKKKEKTNETLKSNINTDWKNEIADTDLYAEYSIHVTHDQSARYERRFLYEANKKSWKVTNGKNWISLNRFIRVWINKTLWIVTFGFARFSPQSKSHLLILNLSNCFFSVPAVFAMSFGAIKLRFNRSHAITRL